MEKTKTRAIKMPRRACAHACVLKREYTVLNEVVREGLSEPGHFSKDLMMSALLMTQKKVPLGRVKAMGYNREETE